MVPNIEPDSILLLGYSILYKEYNPTRFNHQKNITSLRKIHLKEADTSHGINLDGKSKTQSPLGVLGSGLYRVQVL